MAFEEELSMYVCICHALTDRDVRSAEVEGASSDAEVFRHFGVKPQCGRCVPSMRCMLGCRHPASEGSHANDAEPLACQAPRK